MRPAPLLIFASLLLAPSVLAISSNWTGNYLRIDDMLPIHYNGDTGQQNIVGSVLPQGSCDVISPLYHRCGECVYLPDTQNGWKSNVTQFRWGRCVNVDMTTPGVFAYRGDVRTEFGEATFDVRGWVEHLRGSSEEIILPRTPLPTFPCQAATLPVGNGLTTSFSVCHGLAWESPLPADRPAGAGKVCVRLEVWHVEASTQFPNFSARPCREIAS